MRSVLALVVALLLFTVAQYHVAASQYAWFVYYNEFELNTMNHGYVYVPLISPQVWCGQDSGTLHCYAEIGWHVFYVFNFDLRPMIESSPDNALNFTSYVMVKCLTCEAGIALLNSAKDWAFNVVISGDGYVYVRLTNFVGENEVYNYPTDVGYIGNVINVWFKVDVGVEIDYAGNMNTSVRISDLNGNVLYSYSGVVYDVTAYQDYRYPAVYVYSNGYADNYGIYYPSLAIRGQVATVTSTETVTSIVSETTTTTIVEPTTVTSTESVVVPVERWSTVTTTVTEKADYTAAAVAAAVVVAAVLLLIAAIYVMLKKWGTAV